MSVRSFSHFVSGWADLGLCYISNWSQWKIPVFFVSFISKGEIWVERLCHFISCMHTICFAWRISFIPTLTWRRHFSKRRQCLFLSGFMIPKTTLKSNCTQVGSVFIFWHVSAIKLNLRLVLILGIQDLKAVISDKTSIRFGLSSSATENATGETFLSQELAINLLQVGCV